MDEPKPTDEEIIEFVRRYYAKREKADAFFFEMYKEQMEWFLTEFLDDQSHGRSQENPK